MAALIFAVSVLSILTTVGILFALMVRLASFPRQTHQRHEKPIPPKGTQRAR